MKTGERLTAEQEESVKAAWIRFISRSEQENRAKKFREEAPELFIEKEPGELSIVESGGLAEVSQQDEVPPQEPWYVRFFNFIFRLEK